MAATRLWRTREQLAFPSNFRPVFMGVFSPVFRPYHKPNPFYEKLKSEHDEVMLQLKRLEEENTMASQKFSELTKETVFYR